MADELFDAIDERAALTTQPVLDGIEPILFVSHDVEDGLWQFLQAGPIDEDTVRYVALRAVLARDPGVAALTRLPLGWEARRRAADEPWSMYPRCC